MRGRLTASASPRPAPPAAGERTRAEFAADVARDLRRRPRQLQSKYFYDALGSHLFEAICHLPWYKITRAEWALLERHAADILRALNQPTSIVELGCGSGGKLALLAEVCRRPVLVQLVDVSRTALELSARTLGRFPNVAVVGHNAVYDAGLRDAARRRPARGAMLVLFLGSNVGNYEPAVAHALLTDVRAVLRPGDGFLLGADLVKPETEMVLAYGDPIGVTAAFNKNLLARINRELGGDFDLGAFGHASRWNATARRMESYLVSQRAQRVRVRDAGITIRLAAGEEIWTESSYKYEPEELVAMGAAAGLGCARQWVEAEAGFALTLLTPAA
jgi:dimethylhistidine N-methyltransferase